MPRRRPRDKLGTSQGHLGHLGLIYVCKSMLKGQNVPGTDGTYHGTDGTCPRDRCWAFPDGALFGNFRGAISAY